MEEIPDTRQQPTIHSPFSGVETTVPSRQTRPPRSAVWTGLVLLALALAALAVFFVQRAIYNPLRTLQPFPLKEYYQNHSALEGTRYRADLKVISQLGWKEDFGRLIICNVEPSEEPVVILISPREDGQTFEPGDTYQAELLIGEGGLLTARHLTKE